jgi:hypothetical protein
MATFIMKTQKGSFIDKKPPLLSMYLWIVISVKCFSFPGLLQMETAIS